ncbi:hypothetical protein [Aeromicrobium sp.]|uniref:hypothetical protein n=1 Tax=Aeromicrobium sp. TaxID=1871063 RepID=UPI0030C639DD
MDEEIEVPINLPLDSDGFLRRECPSCVREFKWFSHDEGDPDAEQVTQYFCPLCGVPAGLGSWWTQPQLNYVEAAATPGIERLVEQQLGDMFKGMKNISYKPNQNFHLDGPDSEPLHEPDDMMIVEPPCHPNEPLKVPDEAIDRIHCLICGSPFAA